LFAFYSNDFHNLNTMNDGTEKNGAEHVGPHPKGSRGGPAHKPSRGKKAPKRFYLFVGVLVVFVGVVIWGSETIKSMRKRWENQSFLHDMAVIQEAFVQLAEGDPEHRLIPVETGHEAEHVEATQASISGNWHIEQTPQRDGKVLTEIVVTNPDRTIKEMEKLDAQIDDGDLSTGNFVLKGRDSYGISVMEHHVATKPPPDDSATKREKMVINNRELDQNYLKLNNVPHAETGR
jgi:hypothetical protein